MSDKAIKEYYHRIAERALKAEQLAGQYMQELDEARGLIRRIRDTIYEQDSHYVSSLDNAIRDEIDEYFK